MDALRWIETSGAAKLLITDNVNNGNRLVKRLNRKGRAVSSLTVSTSRYSARGSGAVQLCPAGEPLHRDCCRDSLQSESDP